MSRCCTSFCFIFDCHIIFYKQEKKKKKITEKKIHKKTLNFVLDYYSYFFGGCG